MAAFLLAACSLGAPLAFQAAQLMLSGEVRNARGTAVAGAEVEVVRGTDTLRARTGPRGEWRLSTSPGVHHVSVRAIGYRRWSTTLTATTDTALGIVPTAASLPLDAVVVTAARRAQRLADVATTTEIVSRDDIRRTGAADIAQALARQTGINMEGGVGAGLGVMLQGLSSERVLVLVDGHPLAGRIAGQLDVSRIPASVVERIEIVKGAQSTLYGSDAMGGVVNVITRAPRRDGIEGRAEVSGGSQARRDASAGVSIGAGAVALSVDGALRGSDLTPGRSSESGALTARRDVATRAIWSSDSSRIVEGAVMALGERLRWRSAGLYTFSDNLQLNARLGASVRTRAGHFSTAVALSSFDHLSRASALSKPIAGDTGQRVFQRSTLAELLYSLPSRGRLDALEIGALLRRDDAESARVPGGMRHATSFEPFTQLELRLGRDVVLVPGVRVSRSSEWGTRTSPRFAAKWRPGERVNVRAATGAAFRAPSFNERLLFFQNSAAGYAVLGNPRLRPETSHSSTLGVEWAGDRVYARGQVFRATFSNFIEARPVSAPGDALVFRYENVDNGVTSGGELETGARAAAMAIELAASTLRARDRASGADLLNRPPRTGRLTVTGALAGIRASATGIYTARTAVARDAAGATSWREGWPRFDIQLARTVGAGLDLSAVAENVVDRRPAQWAGFTGRRLTLSLSWAATRGKPSPL